MLSEVDLPELPEHWKWGRVGDLVDSDRGICYGIVQPGKHDPSGVPMVNSNDVLNGRVAPEIAFRVAEQLHSKFRRSTIRGGELLLTLVGANFGRVAIAPERLAGYNCSRAVGILPVTESTDYVMYCLRSPLTRHYLDTWANTTAQPTFNLKEAANLPIPIAPRAEQKAIAHVLGSLDDKIELNRRMNETLEGMAQALFKSWFVDFDPVIDNALAAGNPIPEPLAQRAETRRQAIANGTANREAAQAFPASFCFTEELGWIPEGWEVKNWNEIATITKGKSYKSDELQDSKTALVTLKSFNRGGGYRLDGLKSYIGKFKPEQVVTSGDLVIAYTDVTQAADVIGKPALVIPDSRFETLVISLDVAVVKPVSDHLKYYLYGMARSKEFEERMLSFTSGTTVLHLAKNAIPEHSSAIPSEKLLNDYHNVADSNFQRIVGNIEESQTLAKLRDVLMPKLISGELRIPQAEKMVEEAIA